MNENDIIQHRLLNQNIAHNSFTTIHDLVSHLGAVQSQDYIGGTWAMGLRMPNITITDVERAIAERTIVRTWPMRGTLHFIASEDIRWMIKLLVPKIMGRASSRHKQLELDEATFTKSGKIFRKALQGGKRITRDGMYKILAENNISPAGQRGIHILQQLAHEELLCFGEKKGKQFTFTLLDEWLPKTKLITREESLAEIAKRYFTSHGPATVADFAWWTGLNLTDARKGLESVKSALLNETINKEAFWFAESNRFSQKAVEELCLLPVYDEYLVGYKNRDAVFDTSHLAKLGDRTNILFHPTILINGQVAGTWTRLFKKDTAVFNLNTFNKLNGNEKAALEKAADKYGKFFNMQAIAKWA